MAGFASFSPSPCNVADSEKVDCLDSVSCLDAAKSLVIVRVGDRPNVSRGDAANVPVSCMSDALTTVFCGVAAIAPESDKSAGLLNVICLAESKMADREKTGALASVIIRVDVRLPVICNDANLTRVNSVTLVDAYVRDSDDGLS